MAENLVHSFLDLFSGMIGMPFGKEIIIFIISMMFADACMDTFRQWKQKNVHRGQLPCYTNPKRSETEH